MRFWYVSEHRERLLDTPTVVLFIATLVIILVWLLPRDAQFREMLAKPQSDLVALRYAELMATLSPNDTELKYLLAFQYYNIGRVRDALATIEAVPRAVADTRTRLLHLTLLERLYFDTEPAARSARWLDDMRYLIGMLGNDPTLVLEDRYALAATALRFGMPALAAEQYAVIAAEADPAELLRAARYTLQAGDPGEAGELFRRAVEANIEVDDALAGALESYRASDALEEGAALIEALLARGQVTQNMVLPAARFLQAAARPSLIRKLVAASAEYPFRGDALRQWVDLAVSVGEVEHAANRIEWLLRDFETNPAQRLRVAQLYTWNGRLAESLEHWQWLTLNAPALADLEETVRLATITYRYDAVIDVLSHFKDERALTSTERERLIHAYVETGQPDAAIAVLRDYLEDKGNPSQALEADVWRRAITLLTLDEQFDRALDWWEDMSRHVPLTTSDLLALGELHWRNFDHTRALAAYLEADPEEIDQPESYWQNVALLAWEEGNDALASTALLEYAKHDALDQAQYDMLLAALPEDAVDARRLHAIGAWRATRQPQYLLSALAETFGVDTESFRVLLAEAMADLPLFERSTLFWALKARYHQREGELDEAWVAFEQSVRLQPNDPTTLANAFWFLIEADDPARLAEFLRSHATLAHAVPELAHPVAAAFAKLGNDVQAAYWFERALAARPDNHEIGLAFADSLLAAGSADAALRMRRHVLERSLALRDDFSALDVYVMQRASLGLLTIPEFNQLLPPMTEGNKKGLLDALMSGLLDAGHVDGLLGLYAVADQHRIEPDPYVDFYIALNQRDVDALDGYRDAAYVPTRAEALNALGEGGDALQTALNALHDRTTATERQQLRRLAVDLQHQAPYGFDLTARGINLGDIESSAYELRSAAPYRAWHLDTRWSSRRYDPFDATGVAATFDEQVLTIDGRRPLLDGQLSVGALVARSSLGNWHGARIGRLWQLDRAVDVRTELELGALADETPLLHVFGRRDAWQSSIAYRPTETDLLSATLAFNRFEDRWSAPIGRGIELTAAHEHALLLDAPGLRVVTSLYLMQNDRESAFGTDLQRALGRIAPDDVLPDRSARLSTGLVLQRGDPAALNRRVPSPHYRLAVFTGYQWPEGGATLNFEASVAAEVFGRDLLRLAYGYASQPLAGTSDAGFNWSLSYRYRFGK